MDQAILSVELKLVKNSDHTASIPSASKTAIANNALNALWSRSALYLNNVPVNQSTQYHYLKAHLSTLINTARMEKSNPKDVEGYWWVDGRDIDTESGSWLSRKQLFLGDGGKFHNARLCGFIYHDLVRFISKYIINHKNNKYFHSNQTWLEYHLVLL